MCRLLVVLLLCVILPHLPCEILMGHFQTISTAILSHVTGNQAEVHMILSQKETVR